METLKNQKKGIITIYINDLVNKRKEIKRQIQQSDKRTKNILDLKQKAYKLIANSLYGLFGYHKSKFYS